MPDGIMSAAKSCADLFDPCDELSDLPFDDQDDVLFAYQMLLDTGFIPGPFDLMPQLTAKCGNGLFYASATPDVMDDRNALPAINIVPDRCVIDVGFRVLPGMEARRVAERIRSTVAEAVGGEGQTGPFDFDRLEESPPLLLDAGNDLYAAVCDLVGQEETVSVSYATDGGWLATAGFDCLIWGPGTIEVAHKPNESMPKDEYARASDLLEQIVDRFCVAEA